MQTLNSASPQTTIKTITAPALKELKLPLPTISEQSQIAAAVDSIQRKIDLLVCKTESLRQLFRTLLHELMTAQLRVHELDMNDLDTRLQRVKHHG